MYWIFSTLYRFSNFLFPPARMTSSCYNNRIDERTHIQWIANPSVIVIQGRSMIYFNFSSYYDIISEIHSTIIITILFLANVNKILCEIENVWENIKKFIATLKTFLGRFEDSSIFHI